MKKLHLTILLCSQHGKWVAQCVEHDIAAQADSVEDVLYEIQRIIISEAVLDFDKGREPLSEIPRAPEHFSKLAESALKVETRLPTFEPPNRISGFFVTEPELLLCTT